MNEAKMLKSFSGGMEVIYHTFIRGSFLILPSLYLYRMFTLSLLILHFDPPQTPTCNIAETRSIKDGAQLHFKISFVIKLSCPPNKETDAP